MRPETTEDFIKELKIRSINKTAIHAQSAFYGYCIIFTAVFVAILFIYSAFLAKLLPHTGYVILDSIKDDYYFCYLVPLTILPTYLIIYLNWLAMRHFEQN